MGQAQFVMCSCGKHAHVLSSNGETKTLEFYCKATGVLMIAMAYMDTKALTLDDSIEMTERVMSSSLPDSIDPQLEMIMALMHSGVSEDLISSLEVMGAQGEFTFRMGTDDQGNACGYFYGPCKEPYEEMPLSSKQQALRATSLALLKEMITAENKKTLDQAINDSPLPDRGV